MVSQQCQNPIATSRKQKELLTHSEDKGKNKTMTQSFDPDSHFFIFFSTGV
jgi:hypothetical protein